MKKILLVAVLLLCVCQIQAQRATAEIEFDKTVIDLGQLVSNNPVDSCTFTFKNTGKRPLMIVNVFTSCTCTSPDYTQKQVNPGERGYIKIHYDGHGSLLGKFTKTITVYSNAQKSTVRLQIKGEIVERRTNTNN